MEIGQTVLLTTGWDGGWGRQGSGHSPGTEEGQRPVAFEIRRFRDGQRQLAWGARQKRGGLGEQTPFPE